MLSRDALITFIKEKLALGTSRDEIVATLSEYGGDSALVDEVMADQHTKLAKVDQERDLVHQYLVARQSFLGAVLAGAIAAILSAVIWATIAYLTDYQIGWVAIILGCLVGQSVRRFGKGSDLRFRVIGLVSSLSGIFLGNAMIVSLLFHRMLEIPLMDVLPLLGDSQFYAMIAEMTTILDAVFYLVAALCGWSLSVIPMTREALAEYTKLAEIERRS